MLTVVWTDGLADIIHSHLHNFLLLQIEQVLFLEVFLEHHTTSCDWPVRNT